MNRQYQRQRTEIIDAMTARTERALPGSAIDDVAAVLAPCSSRKALPVRPEATAVSLARATQVAVETEWLALVAALPPAVTAADLYRGRGASLARQAAQNVGAPLYIISAGLGLVPSQQVVPTYGLTVGGRGPDAIRSRVRGSFDVGAWWAAVERGSFSVPLVSIFDRAGLVLGALTQPYAKMLAPCLDALSDEQLARVRLFGAGLSTILPLRLRPALMPYDARLQALLPGTQADFPQRALSHFVASVMHARPSGGSAEHYQAVLAVLREAQVQTRLKRPRLSDSEMLKVITAKLGSGSKGIQRTLRALRDEDKIACEQARFSRLYRLALEQRVES